MNKSTWVLAAALSLISAPALSDDDSGFYAGVGAGMFGIGIDDFETGLNFDDSDTGFRAFGGWQFNRNFGVELGYVDGGTASETIGDITVDGIEADVDVGVSGFDVSLVGTLPFSDTFYGYAKLGMLFWDADLSATVREDDGEGGVITTSDSGSESDQDLAYGAGLGVNIGDNAAVQVEYTIFDVTDTDADFLSANFVWRFR